MKTNKRLTTWDVAIVHFYRMLLLWILDLLSITWLSFIFKINIYFCFSQRAFQGTVVTIENFLSWKAKFEQEMVELKKKTQKEEEQAGKGKLTGELKT